MTEEINVNSKSEKMSLEERMYALALTSCGAGVTVPIIVHNISTGHYVDAGIVALGGAVSAFFACYNAKKISSDYGK
jgi:hypothetical protein